MKGLVCVVILVCYICKLRTIFSIFPSNVSMKFMIFLLGRAEYTGIVAITN